MDAKAGKPPREERHARRLRDCGMGVTAQHVGLGIESRELRAQAVDLALADVKCHRLLIGMALKSEMTKHETGITLPMFRPV